MNHDRNRFIGIDIGATHLRAVALYDLDDQAIPHVVRRETPSSLEILIRELHGMIAELLADDAGELAAIGVGFAGMVDREHLVILRAPNLPWLNSVEVRELFPEFRELPIRLDNDARCLLRAEALWGAARGKRHALAIAVGTGIGGGLLIDGRVYSGASGIAGEFGHMIFDAAQEWEEENRTSIGELPGASAEIIGRGVANLVKAFDPEVVILGGGPVVNHLLPASAIAVVARKYLPPPFGARTEIVAGTLGDAAQAVGAALQFTEPERYVSGRNGY